jgi:hypothetical protein
MKIYMLKDFNYPLTPKGKNAAEKLTKNIIANYNNQLQSSTIVYREGRRTGAPHESTGTLFGSPVVQVRS